MQEALESYSTIGCLQWRWFGISDEAFQLMTCKLFPFLAISSDTEKNNCVPVCPSRTYKHSQVSTFHTLTVMSWDPLTLRKEYWRELVRVWPVMDNNDWSILINSQPQTMYGNVENLQVRRIKTQTWDTSLMTTQNTSTGELYNIPNLQQSNE
jgi:hypothetical protein